MTKKFLTALWPDGTSHGGLTIFRLPNRKSTHFPAGYQLTDEDLATLKTENDAGSNIYYVLGLLEPGLKPGQRGQQHHIVALPGFGLDIDFFHPDPRVHKARNLPPGMDEVALILGDTPEPSLVVSTGYGVHLYWRFNTPLLLDSPTRRKQAQRAYREFQAPFKARTEAQGWKFDSKPSLEGVWRLPGFDNRKLPESPVPVEVIHRDDSAHYTLAQLAPSAPAKLAAASEDLALGTPGPALENSHVSPALLADLGRNGNKALAFVLAGQSFAPRGGRDEAMQSVCSTIAWMPDAQGVSPEILAEILRPSLAVWAAEPDATKSLDEELAKAAEKIARAQVAYADKKETEHKQFEALRGALRVNGEPIAEETAAFMQQRAIIQFGHAFFIFDFRYGVYVGPMISMEVLTFARDAWVSAPALSLSYVNAKGELKQKTLPRVQLEYCTKAVKVVGQLGLEHSYYDEDAQTFYDSKAPLRSLEPTHSAEIEGWLALLAGTAVDKLLDWIAAVPQLDEQCCALYLSGASGSGKGLLAHGLSRLWNVGGPAPMERVLSTFNAEMFRCPLILLDEGGDHSSVALRRLIGSSSHTFSEKNLPRYEVRGAVRVLIAANNENVLAVGDENMSADDLKAYIERFLHIHANAAAAQWLCAHNENGLMTRRWIDDDLIAKHCLWLATTRLIDRGQRFIVEGSKFDEIHRKLVMHGEAAGPVYEWLARFLSNPSALEFVYRTKREEPRALIRDGKLLVNAQGILDCWPIYMGDDIRRPTTTRVGITLDKVSEGSVKLGPANGKRITFHVIRAEMILGWSRTNQVGDEDEMQRILTNPGAN